MHWSTTPSKARCFRSDGVVRKRPNALAAGLSNGFGDVAARRALCRVFPARVAPCPSRRGKRLSGALWGNVLEDGNRDFGGVGEGRFWCGIKRGGHKCPSARETPPRNAGRGAFSAGVSFTGMGSGRGSARLKSPRAAAFFRVPRGDIRKNMKQGGFA